MAKQPLYSVILARNCLLTGLSPKNNSWSSGGGVVNESRITFPPEQQTVEVSPVNFFVLQKLQISVIEMAPRDVWLLHSVVEKAIRVILSHFLFLVAPVAVLKHIEYAESEFRTFEFVICKFIVVYMNIKYKI